MKCRTTSFRWITCGWVLKTRKQPFWVDLETGAYSSNVLLDLWISLLQLHLLNYWNSVFYIVSCGIRVCGLDRSLLFLEHGFVFCLQYALQIWRFLKTILTHPHFVLFKFIILKNPSIKSNLVYMEIQFFELNNLWQASESICPIILFDGILYPSSKAVDKEKNGQSWLNDVIQALGTEKIRTKCLSSHFVFRNTLYFADLPSTPKANFVSTFTSGQNGSTVWRNR